MKYLITGGTGFVGSKLINDLLSEKADITVLTRDKTKCNKIFENKVRAISNLSETGLAENIDCIINLAGEPIANKRWSKAQEKKLISSRVETTKALVNLISRLEHKPGCLISTSAIGYYGCQGDITLDENSKPVNEFTHELCKAWEQEALKAKDIGIRVCITRLGVVLGKNGGALQKMLPAFKLVLGGKIGNGQQYFSWVHIDDVVKCIKFLINKNTCDGIYNLTSPNAVTNAEFTKSLARALHRPAFFNMPTFIVKTIFGEMGDRLLLNGQKVYPKKLLENNFKFTFENIDSAIKNILEKNSLPR